MAQTIDFYIDVGSGRLVAAGSNAGGAIPSFTRNDVYKFRVRLQERDTSGFLRDIDTTGTSVKIGVGELDQGPTEGAFRLVLNSVTSSAITYSSDASTLASRIYTAVSNNVATVTTFGSEANSFILTATGTNTAMSFGGDSFTMFPLSSVLISTRRNQSANVQSQQIVKLRRNPAVYADNFSASSTAGIVSISKTQDGGSGTNETYRLSIGKDAEGGGVVLNFGSNSTTAIPVGASATSFAEALQAVTGIGANNISVDSGNNLGDYTIAFVRELGGINVTTDLTLDASNVVFAKFLESTVTFATAELDELFATDGTETITPTLEIEITESGSPKTIYQGDITVRKDLITTGSAIPAAQASYYTKAETDALFVEDNATNVDATGRRLYDSSAVRSIDWNNRRIYTNGNAQVLNYTTGLGFFGNSAVSQPSGTNAVSNVISLGLIASSATYGVLPSSTKTLTTTASINFGTLTSLAQTAVTIAVTGANLNDVVLLGLPAGVTTGLIFMGHVESAGVVAVDCANYTNQSKTQGALTYRITVVGY